MNQEEVKHTAVRYTAFPPIAGGQPRALILGTFPSPMSRQKREYYGNSQNKFWRILFDVFGAAYSDDYDVKKRLLTQNGIALWDVIESCEIVGALDTSIKNPMYNTSIPVFLAEHKSVAAVLFNGGNAYAFYKRGIGDIPRLVLPSTSPANARYTYEGKLEAWRAALGRWMGR